MGVYGTSTFFQGEPVTPPAHPAPPSSDCVATSTIGNGLIVTTTSPGGTVPSPSISQVTSSATPPSTTAAPSSETLSLSSIAIALTSFKGDNGTPTPAGVSTSTSTSTNAASSSSAARRLSTDGLDRLVLTVGSTLTVGMVAVLYLL